MPKSTRRVDIKNTGIFVCVRDSGVTLFGLIDDPVFQNNFTGALGREFSLIFFKEAFFKSGQRLSGFGPFKIIQIKRVVNLNWVAW